MIMWLSGVNYELQSNKTFRKCIDLFVFSFNCICIPRLATALNMELSPDHPSREILEFTETNITVISRILSLQSTRHNTSIKTKNQLVLTSTMERNVFHGGRAVRDTQYHDGSATKNSDLFEQTRKPVSSDRKKNQKKVKSKFSSPNVLFSWIFLVF